LGAFQQQLGQDLVEVKVGEQALCAILKQGHRRCCHTVFSTVMRRVDMNRLASSVAL
jgi:hypothetical protein